LYAIRQIKDFEFIKEFLAPKLDDRDEERELNQISYVEQQNRCTYSALYSVPDIQTGFLAYASDRCKF